MTEPELRAHLEELVNPATDAPAVRRVWIRREIFPGPKQEELPDLIVTWNDEAPIAALASPRVGIVEGASPDGRPGTHSTSGFLMAHGHGIASEYRGRGRLVDVAASVLDLIGVSDTPGLEGTAWWKPGGSGLVSRQPSL